MILSSLLCLSLISALTPESQAKKMNLKSGIYLVTGKSTDQIKLKPLSTNEQILVDDGRFLEETERDPAEYVVVDIKQSVPFVLSKMVSEDLTADKKPRLLLEFAPRQAKDLQKLTQNNLGKMIAVIVDNQIVSCHKIKEAIKGGQMQISRCTKNSCELIYSNLLVTSSKPRVSRLLSKQNQAKH